MMWIVVLLGVVAASLTTASYLGGFLDPDGNARDMPLAVVNADRGAALGTTRVQLGRDVLAELRSDTGSLSGKIRWRTVSSRADALAQIRANRVYAAIVIPANFSSQLVEVGTLQSTTRAQLEVLTNPAAGSYAGSYSQAVATAAADAVDREAAARLGRLLGRVPVPAARAVVLGRPVDTVVTVVTPLPAKGGRGLAPFYFAVMLTLAGVIGGNAVNLAVDFVTGSRELDILGRRVRRHTAPVSSIRRWGMKVAVGAAYAVLGGLAVTFTATVVVGMGAHHARGLAVFAVLGVAANTMITLALAHSFDLFGSLAAVFVTTILGVPSAGGVYPRTAMPAAFRALGDVLPLRYLTDGARALVYFPATSPGLKAAVAVVAGWVVGAVVVGTALARVGAARSTASRRPDMAITTDALVGPEPIGSV